MKKILILVFGIAIGFTTTCGLNFTKAVAQTALPGTTAPEGAAPETAGCGTQLVCAPDGKLYTGEYGGRYYVRGIAQNKQSYENHVRSSDMPLNESFSEPLNSSLNQPLDDPLDEPLNQPLGETQVTDSPTQDDGSLIGDPNQL